MTDKIVIEIRKRTGHRRINYAETIRVCSGMDDEGDPIQFEDAHSLVNKGEVWSVWDRADQGLSLRPNSVLSTIE